MRKYISLLLVITAGLGCDSDDFRSNNRYLPNYNFSIDINLDQPLYSQLQFPANPVLITQAGIGINGVIVTNTGSGFSAFEASCPNQELSACSPLQIDGINAICPCDEVEYNLFTGQASTEVEFPLKPYRVQQTGPNMIRVYN